jgi:hypothetical protein
MAFNVSKPRGSRYQKKINPIKVLIAYEGASDERKYFEKVEILIPKQFVSNFKIIPVDKANTNSSPRHVLADLKNHPVFSKNNIRKNLDYAYIVIDRDHHFSDTHSRESSTVLAECRQLSVNVICTTPAFDLWLLLHHIDISTKNDEYRLKALENKKISRKNSKTFLKNELLSISFSLDDTSFFTKTPTALKNQKAINLFTENENIPNDKLHSNIGDIFLLLESYGWTIF